MKRNKTRSINIQAPAFISHCGGREHLHKASGVRGVLLIALAERGVSPLRIASCELEMTGVEFSLLELLVNHSGKIFSRVEILQQLWGFVPEMNTDTRVVDVHISRLRTKVESDPNNPEFIITARGNGYFFPRIVESE